MSNKNPIKLIGKICQAEIIDERLRITVSIGEQSASFDVPIFEAQGRSITRLCWALGIMKLNEASQFLGKRICLHLIQPPIADGLVQHLIVVDYQGVK